MRGVSCPVSICWNAQSAWANRLKAIAILGAVNVGVPGLAGQGDAVAGVNRLVGPPIPQTELGVHNRVAGGVLEAEPGRRIEFEAAEHAPSHQLTHRAQAIAAIARLVHVVS